MGNETRERLALRMQPGTRRRIEQWYAADNCQSMNEFVEKAVNFYVDHLEIQDNQMLLPMAIQSANAVSAKLKDFFAKNKREVYIVGTDIFDDVRCTCICATTENIVNYQ